MLLNYACFCFPTIFFVVVWLKEWDGCQKEGEYVYVPPQTSRKQLSWVLSEGKPEGRVSHQPLPSDGAPTGNSHPSFLMGGHHKCCWFFYCNFPIKNWSYDMDRQDWIFFIFLRKKSHIFFQMHEQCTVLQHDERRAPTHTSTSTGQMVVCETCYRLQYWIEGCRNIFVNIINSASPQVPRTSLPPRCHAEKLTSDLCET